MGLLKMRAFIVAFLSASLCDAAPVSDVIAVLVGSPVSVHRGQTTTIPCWLNPPRTAEDLEVRWYRQNRFDNPVMLYRAGAFEYASQDASYVGRVLFGNKDAASGGLKSGDVSLALINATLDDAGDYTCYVSSDQGYDSASVSLTVSETGTPLLLSAVWREDNKVNVSCESAGWYPEPSLQWMNQNQVVTPERLQYSTDSSGLVSVHSWLLISNSSEVSCSVGLSGKEAKMSRVRLGSPPKLVEQECGSSAAVLATLILLLIAMVVVIGVLSFKYRVQKTKLGRNHDGDNKDETDAPEKQKLLLTEKTAEPEEETEPTTFSEARKHYVNVTLDQTGNQFLTIKDCKVRDSNNPPDGKKVTCLTAIKGKPGFSSGQHYWEVSLWTNNVGIKQSWWIGVTSNTDVPHESDLFPTASNGFWFLSSSPDRPDSFHLSTEPKVLLPVRSRPRTIGVYLNYDDSELSFYDAESQSLIGSLKVEFTGDVFPFFNPGKGDTGPMEILQHRKEEG
uniref:butyrophilin subfamily 2 member A2-like n=1 Tax=Scatophagus argus TaxID=75038 RepID=UPI001ED7FD2D|nr:butyrophilin subfamily 2 member A2-like [Scatophagus argus]